MTSEEFMCEVVAALNSSAIRYMVVGSLSSNIYGVPRSTKDADFVVELGSNPIATVMTHLGENYQLDPQMSFETITATMRYRIKHLATAFLIELFLISDDAHDQERFRRRRIAKYNDRDVYVATAEDVVITKLRWSRQGQRSKDVDDVRSVISVRGERLDWDYIHGWCDVHGTRPLLQQVLTTVPKL